jgi:hypothetical protein
VKVLRVLSAVAGALALVAALSAEATALPMTCALALNSSCGSVTPHGDDLRACLNAHSARLNRSCGSRFPHIVAVASRCEADARRFCSHVARMSALPSCMEHRLHEAGRPCRTALAKIGLGNVGR